MDRLVPIATLRTPFSQKFGVPRQSGTEGVVGRVEFHSPYGDPNAFRGLEGYSHVWLLWGFSQVEQTDRFVPTVRPPRLGGNTRMGVFATRSPFRPNPIGMSVVKLLKVEVTDGRVSLVVEGVDMTDGTPVYDVKPYLPHADCIPQATGGWSAEVKDECLSVVWDCSVPEELRSSLEAILAQDPRPHYIDDSQRVYGFAYLGHEVKFAVKDDVLHVLSVLDKA